MAERDASHLPDGVASLLIEAMAEGVFTLDREGRIALWNRSMERISGFQAQEVLGRSCRVLGFDRCLRRQCPKGVEDCGIYVQGAVDGKECVLRHRDGHDVPVMKSARVVRDGEGGVVGVVETVTDLTGLRAAQHQAREAVRRLEELHGFSRLVGRSAAMQRVTAAIRAAAASEATVLIQGESGSGKELVAGAIHFHSRRAQRPLVTVNCSALPETLLESELFGHAAGAFTGASRPRTGRFEEAEGGTLFLDEIGEFSPAIQIKLLRVLQQREIQRLGESRSRPIDIRVIAATHRDLYREVLAGRFREDLYYRIKVFPIGVPPLRERREDIPLLAAHFVARLRAATGKAITGLDPQAAAALQRHPWPGNVRELENAMEHAFVLCAGGRIALQDLPPEVQRPAAPAGGLRPSNQEADALRLREVLAACGWNKAEAARRLGLSRTAVWKRMKKLGIPLAARGS
jgi:PAS domain S-box-containing protein